VVRALLIVVGEQVRANPSSEPKRGSSRLMQRHAPSSGGTGRASHPAFGSSGGYRSVRRDAMPSDVHIWASLQRFAHARSEGDGVIVVLFTMVLVVHWLIHLLGFAKAFGLAELLN
jgi:hypothetical protein